MSQESDGNTDREHTELSSPVCYANEADPHYMGYACGREASNAKTGKRSARRAGFIRRALDWFLRR